MTPAGLLLAEEIARSGPVSFRRFMELALYHPEHGYYRKSRDPFGKEGDFYTAEQLQPAFGILMAAYLRRLFEEMGWPAGSRVVELGAGRGEMAPAFSEFSYTAVEVDTEMPGGFEGVVFANEFFDALPVQLVVRRDEGFREMLVDHREGRFLWREGGRPSREVAAFLDTHGGPAEEGQMLEVNLDALDWLEKIGRRLRRGYLVAIDYGYTAAETVRFPAGTLMSYRRHIASEDVLAEPGCRDITAHVNFAALESHALRTGWRKRRFERLAQTLLDAGEPDNFEAALAADTEEEVMRRRLQLKTLLFGMGESFQTLVLEKEGTK